MTKTEKMLVALQEMPLCFIEDYVNDVKTDIRLRAEKCTSLKEALDLGLNSIRLITDEDAPSDLVGWKDPDGTYCLQEPYKENMIATYPVEFVELDTDEENFTVAIFRMGKN